jgi:hypothetical protein
MLIMHSPSTADRIAEQTGVTPRLLPFAAYRIPDVETVTQLGMLKVAGGVAVYSAHIHEVDTQAQRSEALRKFVKAQESHEHERE